MRTWSSEATETEYSSLDCASVLTWPRSRSLRGREIPSTNFRDGTGGLRLRAITFGIDQGVTSEALPIRIQREPG